MSPLKSVILGDMGVLAGMERVLVEVVSGEGLIESLLGSTPV